MSRYVTARFSFEATHQDETESPFLHGHRFTVEATEDSEARSMLPASLASIRRELHLHRLSDMLTGGSETGPGIAAWIMERLLINHPKLTRIEVWWDPDVVYGMTRELR